MKKATLLVLLAALALVFAACDEEGKPNGDETADAGPKIYKTPESLVDAFVKAANSQDKELFDSLFYSRESGEHIWQRITESGLTFSPGYRIEESGFGRHVIFDSARWEGFGTYEQQLYITDELGPGWLINGQDYAFVTEEEAPAEETEETEL